MLLVLVLVEQRFDVFCILILHSDFPPLFRSCLARLSAALTSPLRPLLARLPCLTSYLHTTPLVSLLHFTSVAPTCTHLLRLRDCSRIARVTLGRLIVLPPTAPACCIRARSVSSCTTTRALPTRFCLVLCVIIRPPTPLHSLLFRSSRRSILRATSRSRPASACLLLASSPSAPGASS